MGCTCDGTHPLLRCVLNRGFGRELGCKRSPRPAQQVIAMSQPPGSASVEVAQKLGTASREDSTKIQGPGTAVGADDVGVLVGSEAAPDSGGLGPEDANMQQEPHEVGVGTQESTHEYEATKDLGTTLVPTPSAYPIAQEVTHDRIPEFSRRRHRTSISIEMSRRCVIRRRILWALRAFFTVSLLLPCMVVTGARAEHFKHNFSPVGFMALQAAIIVILVIVNQFDVADWQLEQYCSKEECTGEDKKGKPQA